MVRVLCVLMFLCVFPLSLHAKEVAGVNIADQYVSETGTKLTLNGAGLRSKFVFDVYVVSFYLQYPSKEVEKILAEDGERTIVMHFLYKEVGHKTLVEGWMAGFEANLDSEQLTNLMPSIEAFNRLCDSVKSGDEIVFSYIPGKGTSVKIAGVDKGVVEGKDFNDALLLIWLGKKPVTKKLRQELLQFGANR